MYKFYITRPLSATIIRFVDKILDNNRESENDEEGLQTHML